MATTVAGMTPARDLRLWVLAAGNFAIGTGALMVAGLLPAMAADLGVSVGAMGQSLTAFAVAVAISGPIMAGVTSRLDRKTVLITALAMFALGNLACAFASDYWQLIIARVFTGLGGSMFTPHASGAAALMVSGEQRGRAIALVFIGFTASTVAGIPLGTWLGDVVGWRGAFVAVAVVVLIALTGVAINLPSGLPGSPLDRAAWRAVATNRIILLTLLVTVIQALGQFVAFTYLGAYFKQFGGSLAAAVGLMFALYGMSGIAGNVVGGRAIDRSGPARVVEGMLVVSALGMVLLPISSWGLPWAAAAMLIWGFGAFAINSAQQPRLIGLAPQYATATLPLNSSSIYVGQALGALIGAGLVAGPGYMWLGPAGALGLLAAIVISKAASRAA